MGMLGFWIGCSASAFYNCVDLCAVAQPTALIYSGTICCDCSNPFSPTVSCDVAEADIANEGIGGREPELNLYQVAQGLDLTVM